MTLISQTSRKRWSGRVRGSGSGSYRRRRRKRRYRAGAIALGVVAGVLALWWLWGGDARSRDAPLSAQPGLIAQDPAANRQAAPASPAAQDIARTGREAMLASLPGGDGARKQSEGSTGRDEPPIPVRTLEMGSPPAFTTPAEPEPVNTVAASNAAGARQPTPVPAPRQFTDSSAGDSPVQRLIAEAQALLSQNRPVEARAVYNRALHDAQATQADRHLIRQRMTAINDALIFSPAVYDGDPFAERYTVRSGDTLSVIAHRLDLQVDWRFLQRINRIADPRRIRVGQTIKVVRGPFHAIIDKSDYRMDVYAGSSSDLMYIRSYRVGLGEHNQTPEGAWVVRPQSKLVNPHWVNPRTGEAFSADNPANPIGERWIGLEGVDDATRPISGIGIHGTIEPQTIGASASMGCVRLLPDDVEVVYELLTEGVSKVHIIQ